METSISYIPDAQTNNILQVNPNQSLKTSHATFESKEDTDISMNSIQIKQQKTQNESHLRNLTPRQKISLNQALEPIDQSISFKKNFFVTDQLKTVPKVSSLQFDVVQNQNQQDHTFNQQQFALAQGLEENKSNLQAQSFLFHQKQKMTGIFQNNEYFTSQEVTGPNLLKRQSQNIQYTYKGMKNFKIQKKPIAEGAIGEIFQAIHKQSQEVFALKRVNKQRAQMREQIEEVNNERKMLQVLKHPGIIQMKSAWSENGYFYILQEFALNGDLSDFIRQNDKLDLKVVQYFAAQILNVLAYLRSQNIVHQDIKPANILLNEKWQVQVADFGTAKKLFTSNRSQNSNISNLSNISDISGISGCSASNVSYLSSLSNDDQSKIQQKIEDLEIVGSEHYISPEMIETKQSTYSSDLWALGVIIYQMLSGKIPFKGKTQENTFEKIKSGVFEMDQSIPRIAQDLIKKLLVINPEKRLGSVFLNELMTHEFFEGIDFENISTQDIPMKIELSQRNRLIMKYLPKYIQAAQTLCLSADSSQMQSKQNQDDSDDDDDVDKSVIVARERSGALTIDEINQINKFKQVNNESELDDERLASKSQDFDNKKSSFIEIYKQNSRSRIKSSDCQINVSGNSNQQNIIEDDDVVRSETACFGASFTGIIEEKKSPAKNDAISNQQITQNEKIDSQIFLSTTAGKNYGLFFYSTRKIHILKDGSFAYSCKNNLSKIKYIVHKSKIKQIVRKNNSLSLLIQAQTDLSNQESPSPMSSKSQVSGNSLQQKDCTQLIFKFQTQEEAIIWYNQLFAYQPQQVHTQ